MNQPNTNPPTPLRAEEETLEERDERRRRMTNYAALQDACYAYHTKDGPQAGGAMMCICGAGGGMTMKLTIKGHDVRVEDWAKTSVPINQRWRAILRPSLPNWRIFYGETREEALGTLEASL